MDYEKLHNETLSNLQEMVSKGKITEEVAKGICADFVAESENERIRKGIIDILKVVYECADIPFISQKQTLDSYVAWLEKQNSNVDNANKEYWRGYREGKQEILDKYAELEKQGEQKPIDKIQLGKKYKCIASPRYSAFMTGEIYKPEDKFVCSLMNLCSDCFEPIEDGEQKHTDKVEPKFEIGDLITNGVLVGKIDEIHELGYHAYFGDHYADVPDAENWHKWTIQDAMDNGLSTCTFIYKSVNNVIIQKYASYNKFGFEGTAYLVLNDGYVIPATKEQRNLLFQKMKDAGYEWDANKKELKWLKSFLESLKPNRCEHKWKCIHQVEERIFDEPWDKYPSEINLIKTWECQKCGEIKETIIRK